MENDLVLVVTPVYSTKSNGRLPLSLQTIYWVLNQTHKNHVHAIVDDGSTDETPELLEKLAYHHSSIQVFHQANLGQSSAINFGIDGALKSLNPGYVTVIHSDDLLMPDSLENRVRVASETGSKMVYSDLVRIYEDGSLPRLVIPKEHPNPADLHANLLNWGRIPYHTMLWEVNFFINRIGGYDPRLRHAEDWDIAIRTAENLVETGSKSRIVRKITAVNRVHRNSLGQENFKNGTALKCYKMILAKHFHRFNFYKQLAKAYLRVYRNLHSDTPIVSPGQQIPEYATRFLDNVSSIDYPNALLTKGS